MASPARMTRSSRGKGKAADDQPQAPAGPSKVALNRIMEDEEEVDNQGVSPGAHSKHVTNTSIPQEDQGTITLSAAQLQQIIAQSLQAAMAVQNRGLESSQPRLSPLDTALLRQLTDIQMFDGDGDRSWDDFEQEFTNKASMVSSLAKEEWVRMMHSRVTGQALNHARAIGLLVNGSLTTTCFETYCSKMRDAMFGEATTNLAKLQKVLEVTQTGKFADPTVFLKEKERYLNKLPADCMAGWVKAGLAMQGMDPILVAAISPNPHSQDGQYHSYEELRKAVVATVGLNKMLLPNNGSAGKESWQKFSKSFPSQSQGSGAGSSQKQYPQKHQSGAGSSQPKAQPAAQTTSGKKVIGNRPDKVCSDCGHPGHYSKTFHMCPKSEKKEGRKA